MVKLRETIETAAKRKSITFNLYAVRKEKVIGFMIARRHSKVSFRQTVSSYSDFILVGKV